MSVLLLAQRAAQLPASVMGMLGKWWLYPRRHMQARTGPDGQTSEVDMPIPTWRG